MILSQIALLVALNAPVTMPEYRNGMWCDAPRPLVTDTTQTVRYCTPVKR